MTLLGKKEFSGEEKGSPQLQTGLLFSIAGPDSWYSLEEREVCPTAPAPFWDPELSPAPGQPHIN